MGAGVKLPPYADPVERRKSIGSSDISVILGVSKFMSPCQLYLQKRGELEPQSETQAMRMGKKLEPVCAEIYTEDTGIKLRRRNITQRLKGYDFITSHIDREAVGFHKIVEIKCPGVWGSKGFGDVGTDDIPLAYLAQVQWQMGICGMPAADVAVLCGHAFGIYPVEFDKDLFATMLEKAIEFWARVQEGRAPDPESEADCKALWPKATKATVTATANGLKAWSDYRLARDSLKQAKFILESELKEHEVLECDDGTLATYKNSSSKRFDSTAFKADHPELYEQYTKTTESRRLLIKEIKDE